MRVCFITKYPPIEGGVSTQSYWLSRLLAEAGHDVHVVTNAAAVEPAYRLVPLEGDDEMPTVGGPGRIQVHRTQSFTDRRRYTVPAGEPTVTRLAGVAAQVIRENDVEAVLSWYFEPYGIAASLVSGWLGVPHLARHAGSDLYELGTDAELGAAYRELLRASDGVLSTPSLLDGSGLRGDQQVGLPAPSLPAAFGPAGKSLGIASAARYLKRRGNAQVRNVRETDPGLPLIASYGKLGRRKGTFALIEACAGLAVSGNPVQLALVGGGPEWPAIAAAIDRHGVSDLVWTLPWRIPELLREASAGAYLEHDFGIAEHRSIPPMEILASGRPLLISRSAAATMIPDAALTGELAQSISLVDPTDPADLLASVPRAVAAPAPDGDAVRQWFGAPEQVAAWYGEALRDAAGRAGPVAPPRVPAARIAESLQRWCPVASRRPGFSASMPATAANPVVGAYLVLRETLTEPAGADPTEELAWAEFLHLWSRIDGTLVGEGGPFAEPVVDRMALDSTARAWDELVPVCSRWARWGEFGVDVSAHLAAVRRNRVPTGTAVAVGARQSLLFYKRPNLTGGVVRTGKAVARAFAAVDGVRTVGQLRAALPLGVPGEWWDVLLRQLGDRGVIGFRRARWPAE